MTVPVPKQASALQSMPPDGRRFGKPWLDFFDRVAGLLMKAGGSSSQIQYNNAGDLAGASGITTDGSILTLADNLSFTGTGKRITGNFSATSHADRLLFQSSVTDGRTGVGAIPNGSGTIAAWNVFNADDPGNAGFAQIYIDSTNAFVKSSVFGTGTQIPLILGVTESLYGITIDETGNVIFNKAGQLIQGDFSNATQANRVFFQTSTANSSSTVAVKPSGTGTASTWTAFNANDPGNAGFVQIRADATAVGVGSSSTGTGTTRNLDFRINNTAKWELDASSFVFRPVADNSVSFADSTHRPTVLWAVSGTISTSDARLKTEPRPFTEAEIATAIELGEIISIWQWLDAIAKKGPAARLHTNPTVQAAMEVMARHGLDPFRYAFICYDKWDREERLIPASDDLDEAGNPVTPARVEVREAGDRYSFRETQLLAFIVRGQAENQKRLTNRLAVIESALGVA